MIDENLTKGALLEVDKSKKKMNRSWLAVKLIADFMTEHLKSLFSGTISFVMASGTICMACSIVAILSMSSDINEALGNSTREVKDWLYVSVFHHVPTTAKYLGIICVSLLAVSVKRNIELSEKPGLTLKKMFRLIPTNTWYYFVFGFIAVLLLNNFLYKDVFEVDILGMGFISVDEYSSDGHKGVTQWVNTFVNFLKDIVPYVIGSFIFIFSQTTKENRKRISCFRVMISSVLLCFAVDTIYLGLSYEITSLLAQPIHLLFRTAAVSQLFIWSIYVPMTSFFALLMAGVFMSTLEVELETKGIIEEE